MTDHVTERQYSVTMVLYSIGVYERRLANRIFPLNLERQACDSLNCPMKLLRGPLAGIYAYRAQGLVLQ